MYKTVMVHVDESAQARGRIAMAARLARDYEAHLVGAAVTGLSSFFFPPSLMDPTMPAIVFPVEELRADASRALDAFDKQADQEGLLSFERRCIDDEASAGLSRQGRYCDLIVISQTTRDAVNARVTSDFPESVVLNVARPVLVLPIIGVSEHVGRCVTVAWNGSSNALHAIASAIPLLQRASAVDLVVFDAGDDAGLHGPEPGADMALYLSRHGIRVELSARSAHGDTGAALLAFAVEKGADLIVMGAYGRSRFREMVLGGASRTVLRSSPIALWMAH